MKLLLSSLLLASHCALSSWSVASGTLVVSQSPSVSVMEGETVTISCCWTRELKNVKITWLKNQTAVHPETYRSNRSSNCSALTLRNITTEHSGRYICWVVVDIPKLIEYSGNGTNITVTPRENRKDNMTGVSQDHSGFEDSGANNLTIALAVVAPLLLIALACFCALQRRQAQAARVIYEVPHVDSDVADMDKHSTGSSNGSTQWCQVPVYESFDYFESVQTKGSE